jgi:hypothetical protein
MDVMVNHALTVDEAGSIALCLWFVPIAEPPPAGVAPPPSHPP